LQKYIPEATRITKGSAIDKNGNKIGTHQGYIYYTIGQKRGIDYFDSIKSNLCVIKINAEKNELVIGNDNDLWSGEFIIDDCHFIDEYKVLSSSQTRIEGKGCWPKSGWLCPIRKNEPAQIQGFT
jgi:tRNA U34 2-thiouridine synthase MnmA/TrmU